MLFEPLEQMHVLKDTSDFGANYLMRLVYLHGETPPAFRDHTRCGAATPASAAT